MSAAGSVTLLYTDLASALLDSVGEGPQRVLRAHHRLLKALTQTHGGQDVRWLGDGLLTSFVSPADALRCAVVLQQSARRRAANQRLSIRVALHAGQLPREEADFFGAPVVIVRRLCERAAAGQIVCSSLVADLVAGRQAFAFRKGIPLNLPGLPGPLATNELLHEDDTANAMLAQTPFVGRVPELARLAQRLRDAKSGRGALLLFSGEPGIGKSRTMEEFAEDAGDQGARVLRGRCYEGEWAPPYSAFAEALSEYVASADPEELRADLGLNAAPLSRLVSRLRAKLADIPDPVALQPDEERFRLLDAVAQFFVRIAARHPLVLLLDDLHWADAGSVAMLRHLARFAPRHCILLIGAYRSVEVDASHPLMDALGSLPRETTYEHLAMDGLTAGEIRELLEVVADRDVPEALAEALRAETSGNPFFLREVLLHLVEEGRIFQQEGRWTSRLGVAELGIPDSVRHVIERRLTRLSSDAKRLLSVAAAFRGTFHVTVASRVAGIEDRQVLNVMDETFAAQLVSAGTDPETCNFSHSLVRHTLYGALAPPRRARLHRQIAEAMEEHYGVSRPEHASQIAEQYHRSASLPGAERGIPHCIRAANVAEKTAAFEEAAAFLNMALELLPPDDPRRARIQGRYALALAGSLRLRDAVRAGLEAGDLLGRFEGEGAAAEYLAEAADAIWAAGFSPLAWPLAERGLEYVGDRRDVIWARLMNHRLAQRDASDPGNLGIPVELAERTIVAQILYAARDQTWTIGRVATPVFDVYRTRAEVLERASEDPFALGFWAGDYKKALRLFQSRADLALQHGRLGWLAQELTVVARMQTALGDLAGSLEAYGRVLELVDRLGNPPFLALQLGAVSMEHILARGEGYELMLASARALLEESPAENQFATAALRAACALGASVLGETGEAIRWIATLLRAIEKAPGWAANYTLIINTAARALWEAGSRVHVEAIERNLLEKTLNADFRQPHCDARLAMAQVCALQARWDEAVSWFAKARRILDEQGARPMRAVVDFDEALMYRRRHSGGDRARGTALFDRALDQFCALGMSGWISRAQTLLQDYPLDVAPALSESRESKPPSRADAEPVAAPQNLFRKEGDYWSIAYDGTTIRLQDSKGLRFLAQLFRHPDHEIHALDLVAQEESGGDPAQRIRPSAAELPALDAKAKEAYRRRLDELRDQLAEAEANNDQGRSARARAEIESIASELAAAVGLGGRDRKGKSDAERARQTVTKAIKTAIERIRANHPALARHLATSVHTGYFCSYAAEPKTTVSWVL